MVPMVPPQTSPGNQQSTYRVPIIISTLSVLLTFCIPFLLRDSFKKVNIEKKDSEAFAFDGSVAFQNLKKLSSSPHPLYSRQHIRVREMIIDIVKEIQVSSLHPIDLELVESTQLGPQANPLYPGHILVRLKGQSASLNALLLSAHYDSKVDSYGTTDAASGVVAALEVLRAFSLQKSLPKHSLVLNINANEEVGFLGSLAFVSHPWWPTIRAFINLEGAGAGGRAMLFQSNNLQMTKAFASAPKPHMNIIGNEVFNLRLLPSDTDFRVYARMFDLPGLDIAFYEKRGVYHSSFDDIEHTSIYSIQNLGDNLLSTTKTLMNSDLLERPESNIFRQKTSEWLNMTEDAVQRYFLPPNVIPPSREALFWDIGGALVFVIERTTAFVISFLAVIVGLVVVFWLGRTYSLKYGKEFAYFMIKNGLFSFIVMICVCLLSVLTCYVLSTAKEGVTGVTPAVLFYFPYILNLLLMVFSQYSFKRWFQNNSCRMTDKSFIYGLELAGLELLILVYMVALMAGFSGMAFLYPLPWILFAFIFQTLGHNFISTSQESPFLNIIFFGICTALNLIPTIMVIDMSFVLAEALGPMTNIAHYLPAYFGLLLFSCQMWLLPFLMDLLPVIEKILVAPRVNRLATSVILYYLPLILLTIFASTTSFTFPKQVAYNENIKWVPLENMLPNTSMNYESTLSIEGTESKALMEDINNWLTQHLQSTPGMEVQNTGKIQAKGQLKDKLPFYFQSSFDEGSSQKKWMAQLTMNMPMICTFSFNHPNVEVEYSKKSTSTSQHPMFFTYVGITNWHYASFQESFSVQFNLTKKAEEATTFSLNLRCCHEDEQFMPFYGYVKKKFGHKVAFAGSHFLHTSNINVTL